MYYDMVGSIEPINFHTVSGKYVWTSVNENGHCIKADEYRNISLKNLLGEDIKTSLMISVSASRKLSRSPESLDKFVMKILNSRWFGNRFTRILRQRISNFYYRISNDLWAKREYSSITFIYDGKYLRVNEFIGKDRNINDVKELSFDGAEEYVRNKVKNTYYVKLSK